ncbi:integrase arm-type DNA-binding domain-containing protein [Algoriphagus sp. AGSA1]|uniref:tyrosine-type recombinase/integrase n=1 Tax=Algoriphagus sp. AGSA1 TaxID=2907213 RepID=UPI001F197FE0|nr:integrase arm-type DNA-binding domain-containing protein [Algoriphagus sp. AGSA1]MCE7056876.1 integrase arm-type DNA-binding domain-containing protein [Algoriphagus sp. AGSA1]
MSLTDLTCRKAKPKTKPYKIYDSGGLYLNVLTSGNCVWRYRYRFLSKEKVLTIGSYPSTSLIEAREARDVAKHSVAKGIDPVEEKQRKDRLLQFNASQTYEAVAREWHRHFFDTWTPHHAANIERRLEKYIYPHLGNLPIGEVTPQDVLACVRKIEARGKYYQAKRILQLIGQVVRYGVVTGRANRDFTPDLKDALKRHRSGHFAAIDVDSLPQFLAVLNKNDARLFKQTTLGIKLLMLTFVRTKELINAKWDEFDFEKCLWSIPTERMKMRRPHIVPLSNQTLDILLELRKLYGHKKSGYILPSVVHRDKPISNNTILKGLERLGYKNKMTGHGFRALAMSAIKEHLHYRHEVVDRQLAHAHRNKVDAAYDRAQFLEERAKMMQDWADYIDKISSGN